MNNNNKHTDVEIITYSVLGAGLICYLDPSYTVVCVLGGIIICCCYGIIKILDKYKNIEDLNFTSKENIKYFNNK